MQAKQQKRVLLVEGDPILCWAVCKTLKVEGYSVEVAANTAAGLDQMRRRAPDLVLLDLMPPGTNNWEFLNVHDHQPELAGVPVLVLSVASPGAVRRAQDLGAPVHLATPFDFDMLLHEVDRLTSAPIRQCAWCNQVVDQAGLYRLRSGRKLRWATHGICPSCKAVARADLLAGAPGIV